MVTVQDRWTDAQLPFFLLPLTLLRACSLPVRAKNILTVCIRIVW